MIVSSRSVVRGCRPVPQNWVASGGAGGIRVPAIVASVCVVAAPLLLQVSMSNQLASHDHAHGTQRVPLVIPFQDSMAVRARLSLVWLSASCMFLATHHVLQNGRCHQTFLPFSTQVSRQLRCWQSLRQ